MKIEKLYNGKISSPHMITVQLNNSSNFPITDEHTNLLDHIPERHFTGWLQLPHDPDEVLPLIKKFVQERKGSWDKVYALGMGGSALGIITLQKALFPFDERLIVIDNLDSVTINHHLEELDPERSLVLVISKSGGTLETMTNYEVFKSKFNEEQYRKNFIAITDPQEGKLRTIAKEDGLTSFPIPPEVGGRFSVLTAVGLLPLALLSGDLDQLLKGAKTMMQQCQEKAENNPALQLALAAFYLNHPNTPKGPNVPKNITSIISYSDQLYSLGLWYQQLLAESIGKSEKVGLTPLALRGASDQHSVLQLLQDGPNDKLNIFLDLVKSGKDLAVPEQTQSMHHILRIEGHSTEQALREDGRPTIRIEIPETNEHSLGELFILFEMQIALLGELFQVDAYNQPGVEKSKKLVKAALEK